MSEISCIKDGKTGICRDLKDKLAREDVAAATRKINEIIQTINGMTGGGDDTNTVTAQLQDIKQRLAVLEAITVTDQELETAVNSLQNDIKDIGSSLSNYATTDQLADAISELETAINGLTIDSSNVAVGQTASATTFGVAVGKNAKTQNADSTDSMNAVAVGYGTRAANYSVAVGSLAKANAEGSIQIGEGINTTPNTLQIGTDNIYDYTSHTLKVQNIELAGSNLQSNLDSIGTCETIWTNSSPTSEQVKQTITLDKDLKQYKGFILNFREDTENSTIHTVSVWKEHNSAWICTHLTGLFGYNFHQRHVKIIVPNNQIEINNCWKMTGFGQGAYLNTKLILIGFIGIK